MSDALLIIAVVGIFLLAGSVKGVIGLGLPTVSLGLAIALQENDLLSLELTVISAIAVVPAIVGMIIGRRLRSEVAEDRFRSIVFVSTGVFGAFIIAKAPLVTI